tara:strand:- start:2978 stop:3130 length:153 start_codon:yes stop_codon:yes gene_type:complete
MNLSVNIALRSEAVKLPEAIAFLKEQQRVRDREIIRSHNDGHPDRPRFTG